MCVQIVDRKIESCLPVGTVEHHAATHFQHLFSIFPKYVSPPPYPTNAMM